MSTPSLSDFLFGTLAETNRALAAAYTNTRNNPAPEQADPEEKICPGCETNWGPTTWKYCPECGDGLETETERQERFEDEAAEAAMEGEPWLG